MTRDWRWLEWPIAKLDCQCEAAARLRQSNLIKPPGALGRLEDVAVRLAAMQGSSAPAVERVRIVLFAGDHGVTAEGISAFPQWVTAAMLRCFADGGSAISVLARALDAELKIWNLGTVETLPSIAGVTDATLGPGTANFCTAPAMSETQVGKALAIGGDAVELAKADGIQLLVGGEMGIGNTTSAAALAAALLKETAATMAGPGTGLDRAGVAHKAEVILRALNFHGDYLQSPLESLRRLGGFEIAALAGVYIRCAQVGLPVLVDGYIATVAALVAERLRPGVAQWLIFAHVSAEPGHGRVLQALHAEPLLNLGMRLGEASGAAVAVPLLRLACSLHNHMATFGEAGIAGATS